MMPDYMYGYIHHSFLVYDGKILDITYNKHPQAFYRPDQYWGVAYTDPLMDIPWDFSKKKGASVSLMEFTMQRGGPFMVS
jgi:hypothetical protein